MKKIFTIIAFALFAHSVSSQEVLRVQNGGSITIQDGVNLVLQGGITLENGSSLENKGFLFLKNNAISNISDWTDNSLLGALTGTGVVVFNSNHPQQFTGLTNFYTLVINTNDLTLNNNLAVLNLLRLVSGKVNTGTFYVFLNNNLASALETDAANSSYANSWINGTFRRLITSNTSSYDFPVGIATRSNLLKFINNNILGPNFLTASFGAKPGTDAGLNVTENGNTYTAVNNGGVWYLVPNAAATGGNYALQVYFNGFTGLTDNQFGILRRPDASSNAADWSVPVGSSLEALNGPGRKVSDGFARRYNISDFSQLGIGEFTTAATAECSITGADQVCVSSTGTIYSGPAGMSTYNWVLTGDGFFTGANNTQSVTVNAGSGTGTFTLTLNTTLNESSAQCSKTVTVSSNPVCNIAGSDAVCLGSQNNIYSGPPNMSTYAWTISGGTIVGSANGQTVNVTANSPGGFTLTLDATANNCTSHCSKSVTVNPYPSCSITGSASVIEGSTGNNYAAPPGMNSYGWTITGNGTIVGATDGSSVSVTAGAAGSYTLTLTTTLNGCSTTCTKDVIVTSSTPPDCTVTGSTEVCTGSTNNVYNGPASMSSYAWSISGNGAIIGATNNSSVNVTAGAVGTFTLTLITTLNEGTAQCTKTVTVPPLPNCDITGPSTVTTGSTGNIYSAPLNMTSYSWSITGNGSIIGSTTGQTVSITAGATGSYSVTLITTSNGCAATCSKTVIVTALTNIDCAIAGEGEVCSGSVLNTYYGPAGMSSYAWSISGNGSISGSSNDLSVNVTAGAIGSFSLTLQSTLDEVSCTDTKTVNVKECITACSYTQGFYGSTNGMACFNNSGASVTASQLMLSAFGGASSEVFGNVPNRRFFTLFKSDITSDAIYKMLPGGGNAKAIDVDNSPPYDGASFSDLSTWKLVPIQPNGPQTGRIKNSLLAQTITLWFNISTSTNLGAISLVEDTLITRATVSCGSNTPYGDSVKFGLPHSIIIYLNGNNGYDATVNGLFQLAQDVLGGVNTTVSPSDVQKAIEAINSAFEHCRILIGTIPYNSPLLVTKKVSNKKDLKVSAYPNPYTTGFNLIINSPVSGDAIIDFFTMNGTKVYEMKKLLPANFSTTFPYNGPVRFVTLLYKVTVGKYNATGIVIKPN